MDDQDRPAGLQVGGSRVADRVDQRAALAAGVPGTLRAAAGERVARRRQIGWVRDDEVERLALDGLEQGPAQRPHAKPAQERVEPHGGDRTPRHVDRRHPRAGSRELERHRPGPRAELEHVVVAAEEGNGLSRQHPGVTARAKDARQPDQPHLTHTAESLRATFDAPAPFTLGIEEELMLLDPETLDLAPHSAALLERVEGDGRFKLELPAAQLEIASPALKGAPDVVEFLTTARRDLKQAAAGLVELACSGVHPFADEEGELNAGERYKRTRREYGGLARRQLVFGLQVHVAVRPADRALAVYNGLREHLPELLALAANSPFYRGADTGLAAMRPKLCELLPRQGVPPPLASWDEYADALAWGRRAGGVPEAAVWWWELRPHPSFGTIEVRVPDAQVTVHDAAAIAATVHALARALAERHDTGEPAAPTAGWRIAENRWQALRHGLDGSLADLQTGEPVPVRDRLAALLDELEPHAQALGCSAELRHARSLVESNGANRQRERYADGGMRVLTEWLVEGFMLHEWGHEGPK